MDISGHVIADALESYETTRSHPHVITGQNRPHRRICLGADQVGNFTIRDVT
ncbi:hypothetical protein [Amycolatopsis sp. cmx-11-51]|uniref:hypothetical protein n=1 Tax=Amycolatopsis sp. cmx-11-51 TaxID=2785797 RepID=UPI0039E2D5AA